MSENSNKTIFLYQLTTTDTDDDYKRPDTSTSTFPPRLTEEEALRDLADHINRNEYYCLNYGGGFDDGEWEAYVDKYKDSYPALTTGIELKDDTYLTVKPGFETDEGVLATIWELTSEAEFIPQKWNYDINFFELKLK